jgi:hypothetical protein
MKWSKAFFLISFFVFFAGSLTGQENYFPEMKGLKIIKDYPVYHPDDLWDYIDGAADNYLNYHFADLHIAEYAKGKKVIYKLEIYRFDTHEDAFGIYSSERSPDYSFIHLGAQGYQEETLVFFFIGDYYVKVMVMDESRASQDQLMELARKVEAGLPGSVAMPAELKWFPEVNKIPNSERYLAGDFLGRNYLNGFYTAQYKDGEEAFTVFIRKYESKEEAGTILSRYYEEVMKKKPDGLSEGDYRFDDGYNGVIFLLWDGTVLFGFRDLEDESIMRSMAQKIIKALSE